MSQEFLWINVGSSRKPSPNQILPDIYSIGGEYCLDKKSKTWIMKIPCSDEGYQAAGRYYASLIAENKLFDTFSVEYRSVLDHFNCEHAYDLQIRFGFTAG